MERSVVAPTECREDDPLLAPFLAAPTEAHAQREMDRLASVVSSAAERSIRGFWKTGARMAGERSPLTPEEDRAHDALIDATVRVLRHLWARRRGEVGEPIRSLEAFVVITARNESSQSLLRTNPELRRLTNRVQYLLKHSTKLTVGAAFGADAIGLASWGGRAPGSRHVTLTDIITRPLEVVREHNPKFRPDALDLEELALVVLRTGGIPLKKRVLIGALAALLGIERPVLLSTEELVDVPWEAGSADPVWKETGLQDTLEIIMREIFAAVRNERISVLLGFELPYVQALRARNLLDIRLFAALLGVSDARAAEIWLELAWDNQRIAEMLCCTDKQVASYRFNFKKRLCRNYPEEIL